MITYKPRHNDTEISVYFDGRHVGDILKYQFDWWTWQPLVIAHDVFDSAQYTDEWHALAGKRHGTLSEIKQSFETR